MQQDQQQQEQSQQQQQKRLQQLQQYQQQQQSNQQQPHLQHQRQFQQSPPPQFSMISSTPPLQQPPFILANSPLPQTYLPKIDENEYVTRSKTRKLCCSICIPNHQLFDQQTSGWFNNDNQDDDFWVGLMLI